MRSLQASGPLDVLSIVSRGKILCVEQFFVIFFIRQGLCRILVLVQCTNDVSAQHYTKLGQNVHHHLRHCDISSLYSRSIIVVSVAYLFMTLGCLDITDCIIRAGRGVEARVLVPHKFMLWLQLMKKSLDILAFQITLPS